MYDFIYGGDLSLNRDGKVERHDLSQEFKDYLKDN